MSSRPDRNPVVASVVILTANREKKLAACLESLERQSLKGFETVLVDNAPSGGTSKTVEDFSLDIVYIENPGAASFAEARNRGVEAASGEFVAFLDDDCVADPAWLENLLEAPGQIDAVGGIVVPLRELPFPSWWDPGINWLVGLSGPGLLGREGGSLHYPQTANMAIRRNLLLKEKFQEIGGGFTQKKTRRYAGREDVELWRRLRVRGARCRIANRAVVYHDIPAERIRYRYLMRRSFNDGLVYFRREEKKGYLARASSDLVLGMPFLLRTLFKTGKKRSLLASRSLWMARQAGFISGYLNRGPIAESCLHLLCQLFKDSTLSVFGAGKKLLRRGVVSWRKIPERKRKIPEKPERLLVAACGFLGDMILLAPILQSLRRSLPETKITLLSHRAGFLLFKNTDLVDERILCPSTKGGRGKKGGAGPLDGKTFDAVYMPYFHKAPPELVFRDRNAPVVTFDRDVGLPRRIWYDLAARRVKKDFSIHEIKNLYRLATLVGLEATPEPYRFQIPEQAREKCRSILRENGLREKQYILLHPGAGYPEKSWPYENWIRLTEMMQKESLLQPVFIGDRSIRGKLEYPTGRIGAAPCNLCGKTDLRELMALMEGAALLVTTDSGPKHLAMSMGTPTITLYGPTREQRWGALWEIGKHLSLRALPADLTPEELLGRPSDYAMRMIGPDTVLEAIREHRSLQEK